jgi:hypothetical protein
MDGPGEVGNFDAGGLGASANPKGLAVRPLKAPGAKAQPASLVNPDCVPMKMGFLESRRIPAFTGMTQTGN